MSVNSPVGGDTRLRANWRGADDNDLYGDQTLNPSYITLPFTRPGAALASLSTSESLLQKPSDGRVKLVVTGVTMAYPMINELFFDQSGALGLPRQTRISQSLVTAK
jgi:hypothetical protein